jgi:acyl carrier protein
MTNKDFSEVEKKVARFFVEREGEGIVDILRNSETNLMDQGYLDSLDVITLAAYLEKKFCKKIDLTNQEIFAKMLKFETIVELVR